MPGAGGQPTPRTTFRPPWVKDGPNPLPMPTAPWTLNNRRDSNQKADEAPAFTKVTLKNVPKPEEATPPANQPKKQSKITIIPSQANSDKKNAGQSPAPSKARENGRPEPASRPQLERQVRVDRSRSRGDVLPISKTESATGAPTLSKSSSRAAIPPPPPPRPPPPPPSRNILKDLPQLSDRQQKTIEMLKSRPRKRPDWACMMKEVESGRKLRHVQCNDRSAPLIERVDKVKTDPKGPVHFIYESEKSNAHNQLLHQIQKGVQLKCVKTNDRSKPNLEGLRKFRRQLTIEEQIKKADEPVETILPDEMDDIDAVRDDLQSTKQMLALELRNKEALERDNKRLQKTFNLSPETSKLQSLQFKLQARILNLEAELEHQKSQKSIQEYKRQDSKLSESIKKEAEEARKDAERLEKEYASVSEERDKTKNELEDMKRMYAALERRMKAGMALAGCPSAKDVARIASQKSIDKSHQSNASESSEEEEEEEEEESSEEEESDEEEDPKAAEEKRLQRELKLLQTKIKSFKDKSDNARKERHALREQIKQQNKLLKEEKIKFKRLQKEVDKMAKLMGDTDDDDDDDGDGDDEKEHEEEEEEESNSEDESESEESEEEEAKSDDAHTPLAKQKNNLQAQTKRYEGRLAALKKGNYLLKAQVDRLKDDLAKQREESLSLQEDLDSVLAELG
ncbi:DNA ligase 1-like isoform X2 [Leptopilina heterotoma]|uniref:DNA ligase 1-like isoform X2 n=1 Tax=Leptopilina heterotoma TaxID=63436 RepID=UPI001CA97574|nr:DNA ligase 1-like isoform X2 [Leptopilina heterotoma]